MPKSMILFSGFAVLAIVATSYIFLKQEWNKEHAQQISLSQNYEPTNSNSNRLDNTKNIINDSILIANYHAPNLGTTSKHTNTYVTHIITYPDEIDPVQSTTPDGAYYIGASHVFTEEDAEISSDFQRIIITVSLGNASGAPITVEANQVTLLDQDQHHYDPLSQTNLTPAMIGTQLRAGDRFRGFISFEIPIDTTEAVLELCLSEPHPCAQPIQARLPFLK